jgi:arginase
MRFIGAPIDSVSRGGGAEHAPAALRELGLPTRLGGEDAGDLAVRLRGEERDSETGLLASKDVLEATVAIRDAVAESISGGARPFVAGGCCAVLPGAVAGARDALGGPIGLVHLDGHLDLYDGETSPTGEAADMPVSVVLGLGPGAWVTAAGGASTSSGRTALVGFRDQAESRRYGTRQPEELDPPPILRPPADLRAGGPGLVAVEVAALLADAGPFWLHFDVDVLDRDAFPATDYPTAGGLDWHELRSVLAPLLGSPALAGASLGCFNPDKDPDGACGRELVEVLGTAAG